MDQHDFSAPLKRVTEGITSYINQQIRYNKVLLANKMGEASSYLILFSILMVFASFILFFLSFAFVWWYSIHFGDHFEGYLILAAFYLLLGILVYLFRNTLIFNPLRKLGGQMLFSKEEASDEKILKAFGNKESLEKELLQLKMEVVKQEAGLKSEIEHLGEAYSLSNISSRLMKNLYDSFVTTKNIASISYLLVQKLRDYSSKKKTKKKKKNKKSAASAKPPKADSPESDS